MKVYGVEDFKSIEIISIIDRLSDARSKNLKVGENVYANWFESEFFYEGIILSTTKGESYLQVGKGKLLINEAFKVVRKADVEKKLQHIKTGEQLSTGKNVGDFVLLSESNDKNEGKIGYLIYKEKELYIKDILTREEIKIKKEDRVEALIEKEEYLGDIKC